MATRIPRSRFDLTNAADARVRRLCRIMRAPNDDAGLLRIDRSGFAGYWILRRISADLFGGYEYWGPIEKTGGTLHYLGHCKTFLIGPAVEDDEFTFSGTWTVGANAFTFGGDYRRADSTGAYAEYTTPDGVTAIAVLAFRASNGGYAAVTIDTDATAANELPTAQDEVDAGRLDSGALVANGGTLNPTDRLYSSYSSPNTPDTRLVIATGLDAAAHTVRFTVTGYKPQASTGVRVYLSGLMWSGLGFNPASADAYWCEASTVFDGSSVWEYAMQPLPDGATDVDWRGRGHGWENEVSSTLLVDGDSVTLTDGEMVGGDVLIRQETEMRHPDIGGGTSAIATITTTYKPTQDGLRVHSRMVWQVSGYMAGFTYPAMHPLSTTFDRVKNLAQDSASDVTDADGSFKSDAMSQAIVAWNDDYGAGLFIPAPPKIVDDWAWTSSRFLTIEDRSDGLLNKIYLVRNDASGRGTFIAGEVWELEKWYLLAPFDDPETLLSGV